VHQNLNARVLVVDESIEPALNNFIDSNTMGDQRGRIEPPGCEQVDNSVPFAVEITNTATNLLLV
jgi:hypothetical protein